MQRENKIDEKLLVLITLCLKMIYKGNYITLL